MADDSPTHTWSDTYQVTEDYSYLCEFGGGQQASLDLVFDDDPVTPPNTSRNSNFEVPEDFREYVCLDTELPVAGEINSENLSLDAELLLNQKRIEFHLQSAANPTLDEAAAYYEEKRRQNAKKNLENKKNEKGADKENYTAPEIEIISESMTADEVRPLENRPTTSRKCRNVAIASILKIKEVATVDVVDDEATPLNAKDNSGELPTNGFHCASSESGSSSSTKSNGKKGRRKNRSSNAAPTYYVPPPEEEYTPYFHVEKPFKVCDSDFPSLK